MKNLFFALQRMCPLFLMLLVCATGRAQFHEDFNDGEITSGPAWSGDVDKFRVRDGQLELNDTSQAGEACLVTSSFSLNDAFWEIFHRYDGNPSSSNYSEYYLVSDAPDLSGPLNGYFLRIGGEPGSADRLRFYRSDGSENSELISAPEGSALNADGELFIRIRVTRDDAGNWQLSADPEGAADFMGMGAVFDNTYSTTGFCGIRSRYTSSRATGYYFFDDISVSGEGVPDTTAPEILQADVRSDRELELTFSDALLPGSAVDVTNYSVGEGIGFPAAAELTVADRVRLRFDDAFVSGREYLLTTAGLADLHGNVMELSVRRFAFFETAQAGFNDIIVSEIHADPDAITGLPQAEFIELHNRSDHAVQLKNWQLSDGSQSGGVFLPAVFMAPGAYMVLCASQHAGLFSGFGAVIGLDGMPSLNNSADALTLRDSTGRLINHVEYRDTWYRDNLKREGGWSLEMIDTGQPCAGAENWRASNAPEGGTPCAINSVNGVVSDNDPPRVTGVEVVAPERINLIISEKVPQHAIADLEWTVFGGTAVDTVYSIEPAMDRLAVLFAVPMDSGRLYMIEIGGIADCHGNGIAGDNTAEFGLPSACDRGDLRINEILFNPYTGGVDYLEIYNASSKLLTASDLLVAESDAIDTAVILDFADLSGSLRLIFPFDFIVLTSDAAVVQDQYYSPAPEKFLEVDGMPNFPDDNGVATLLRRDLTVLDQVAYRADWHYSLLDDVNGVSLERIDPTGAAQDPHNWHSASSRAGFGTPGYMNSSLLITDEQAGFTVFPGVFTPDGDGMEDFTTIRYTLDGPGYIGNVRVFDSHGRLIKHIARNETLGTSGYMRWDGDTDRGGTARSGLYLVRIDLLDPKGRDKKIHLEVALTAL